MKPKNNPASKPVTCADCIHEWACNAWNVGNIHNMDARNCACRETVQESTAYFLGTRAAVGNCTGCKWQGSTECRNCRRSPDIPDKFER